MTGKLVATIISLVLSSAAIAADKVQLNFGRDVRPILSENCFPCHGQDTKKRMAGLRLDSFEGATADRRGHSAVVPGKPEASLLYQRITAAPARRMPPAYSNHTLTPEQIATLKRWIEEGGHYTKHWAFVPPVRPPLPHTSNPNWVKLPIDAFVLQKLDAEGLHPSPAAAPDAWLRRVSLDLIGLLPTPSEVDSFATEVKRHGDRAYSEAVDRLLASPRYGERMAMDWLDVARYADTHGFNNDSSRSMWRWRDWVIESFNANMPYNRFITEQLAGDLLPHPTLDQLIATGFGRNHVINSEGGIIDEEYRSSYVTDRVRTLGMAWMGLTLECAHCHDHKFDPLTQKDHYRFFAFFNNIAEVGEDGRVANAMPTMQAPTREQQERMRELDAAVSKLARRIHGRESSWSRQDAQKGRQARRGRARPAMRGWLPVEGRGQANHRGQGRTCVGSGCTDVRAVGAPRGCGHRCCFAVHSGLRHQHGGDNLRQRDRVTSGRRGIGVSLFRSLSGVFDSSPIRRCADRSGRVAPRDPGLSRGVKGR